MHEVEEKSYAIILENVSTLHSALYFDYCVDSVKKLVNKLSFRYKNKENV